MAWPIIAMLLTVASALSPPSIPASFYATANVPVMPDNPCSFAPAGNCSAYPYKLVQDDVNQRSATIVDLKDRYAPTTYAGTPAEWFNVTLLYTNTTKYTTLNGLCYPEDGGGYSNMFWWVPESSFRGLGDSDCEIWERQVGSVTYWLCAKDNEPVLYNVSLDGTVEESYEFIEFDAGDDFDEVFEINSTDCYYPPTCGDDPTIDTRDIFVFHPSDNFDVAGQDVADARGDTFFVCEDLESGTNPSFDHDYELITRYTLEHVATIGQYQNCNGYPSDCIGNNDYYVGKEAALGLGYPNAGQCTANILTGNWFSLPAGGYCANDTLTLGLDCTWRVSHVKTINGSCLIDDHDFEAQCIADSNAPFATAERVFWRAFDHDLSHLGGCPPLPYTPDLSLPAVSSSQ